MEVTPTASTPALTLSPTTTINLTQNPSTSISTPTTTPTLTLILPPPPTLTLTGVVEIWALTLDLDKLTGTCRGLEFLLKLAGVDIYIYLKIVNISFFIQFFECCNSSFCL